MSVKKIAFAVGVVMASSTAFASFNYQGCVVSWSTTTKWSHPEWLCSNAGFPDESSSVIMSSDGYISPAYMSLGSTTTLSSIAYWYDATYTTPTIRMEGWNGYSWSVLVGETQLIKTTTTTFYEFPVWNSTGTQNVSVVALYAKGSAASAQRMWVDNIQFGRSSDANSFLVEQLQILNGFFNFQGDYSFWWFGFVLALIFIVGVRAGG